MSKVIHLKRGLDIRIAGEADKSLMASTANVVAYAIKPTDFYGMVPKLLVEEGQTVLAGSPLFFSKADPRIRITSPVSGTVTQICRGPKRLLEEIRIEAGANQEYIPFPTEDPLHMEAAAVKERLLDAGLWACIRQRPYDTIACPDDSPKMIVVSAFDSAPMGPDYDFIAHGKGEHFQKGIDALSRLTRGKLHLNIHAQKTFSDVFLRSSNVVINTFSGKHPVGNVGVQIHHIDPINKGEIVWYVNPQDVIIIGRLFAEGHYDATKIIALAGSELKRTGYHKMITGANVSSLIGENLEDDKKNVRVISGNVLTGTRIAKDGYLGFYDNLLSTIPEGDYYEMLGWISPGFSKFSYWRSFFSWMLPFKKYILDTNIHGGQRALIFTGQYEKVLPMDIYPLQLIKACLAQDVEAMEALGIYEVAPEDFALCEYIDPSKTEIQEIIRQGLLLVKQEMS